MLDPDGELGGGKAGGLRSKRYTEAFLFCGVLDRFERIFEAVRSSVGTCEPVLCISLGAVVRS